MKNYRLLIIGVALMASGMAVMLAFALAAINLILGGN